MTSSARREQGKLLRKGEVKNGAPLKSLISTCSHLTEDTPKVHRARATVRTLRALQDRAGREWACYSEEALAAMLEVGHITIAEYRKARQQKRRAEYLEDCGRLERAE